MLQERIDQVVKGYELREQIGEGGYGVVYRAYQPLVGRDVAVKIILPQYANHPEFIRRFEWEAQLVARIEHPYIVPLYDYWRDPDGAFLVMRWLRGGNLHDALHNRPLPNEQIGRLIEQIGGALASAHRRGVVHRDLKPANILLDEEGNAYLADFGIAKDMGTRASPYQTDASTVVGSPAYISPEQVRAEPITIQTDIYSLGVMLYEILTGQLPFQAPTPIAMMFMHVNDPVPAIRATRPDLSEAVNAVIQKATAKRPADRYADVTTLMRDLRQALASGPAITRRLTDAPPSQPEADTRTTTGGTRSKYDTGLLYLSTDLLAPPVETPVENPYKGLRAFQEADADDFFGRDLLIQLLLARMQEPSPFSRFLAVVGPSGSGKSSVVRAGLVPAIRRGGLPGSHNWFVVEMFPGAHPVEELAQALLRVAVEPPNNLVEPLKLDEHGLLRVVDQVVPGADETEVVLIIDQFEEVFTLVEDEAVRTHFLKSLITAVTDPYSRIRVVVTLRADFYDRPLLYQGFSELMRQRTEVVVPLATEELKQAIISPAERNGLRVDPELVEAIVGDVGEQPGALPLLQYALTEVFERRNGGALTLTPYNASGGVLGALARRAEEIYTGLSPLEQEAARQLFLRLVTLGEGVEDTRRRVRRTELAFINHRQQTVGGANNGFAPAVAEKATLDVVIEQYSQYRLLTADFDPATRVPTVEVAHEALIRTWTRLRQWLDASRDDLRLQRRMTMAAAEWAASGKDRSFLASGARLEQLSSWAEETHLALNAEERDYLAASLAERDAQQAQEQIRKAREVALERRSRVFLRALVSVFAVATVLALGLSVFAFGQRREAQQNFNTAATAEAQAKQNAVRAQDQESLAKQNAERAQEQELLAKQSADEARNLALASGAQAALVQDNLDESRSLALLAADQPNPPPFAEQMLSRAAYEPGARAVLRGHEDYVSSVAYSPDEKLIISGGRNDQQLILWDAATGKPLRYFRGHEDRLRSVLFLPDGQHVLSGSEDKTLKLWDINCSTPSAEICETPIRTFKSHTNEVRNVALRPNSNEFMSASADASLMLWSLDCTTPSPEECDQPIRVFAPGNGGHTQEANQVVFSADGKRALSVSLDTSLVLWEVDTGKVLRRYELPAGEGAEVRSVAFLPGETQALAGGDGRDINIWDLNSGQVIGKLSGHTGTIYYISVSPDGTRALSTSVDNTIILWNIATRQPIKIFHGHGGYSRQVVFNKAGTQAISGSQDKTIRIWDLENGALRRRFDAGSSVDGVAFSADERWVLAGLEDRTAKIWDASTGQTVKEFPWHSQSVGAVAFSPDGKFILTGGDKGDGTLFLSSVESGQIVRKFSFQSFGVNVVAFTPDGKRAVSGMAVPSADDYIDNPKLDPALATIGMVLWDVTTGEPIHQFQKLEEGQGVGALAISPDGTKVYATVGTEVTIWDIASGQQIGAFEGHEANLNDLDLTPDGKLLVSGAADRRLIVWDVASGKPVFTSEPQSAAVTAVAISRDGRYVASSTEGGVFIWEIARRQIIRAYTGHRSDVRGLKFNADGTSLLSSSRDGTVRLWRVETLPELLAWAKANRYISNLTCAQETLYGLEESHC